MSNGRCGVGKTEWGSEKQGMRNGQWSQETRNGRREEVQRAMGTVEIRNGEQCEVGERKLCAQGIRNEVQRMRKGKREMRQVRLSN